MDRDNNSCLDHSFDSTDGSWSKRRLLESKVRDLLLATEAKSLRRVPDLASKERSLGCGHVPRGGF